MLYGNRAGALFHHLTKGLKVSVEGRLRYRTYLKDDEKRSRLDVVVDEIEFISPRAAQQHVPGFRADRRPSLSGVHGDAGAV